MNLVKSVIRIVMRLPSLTLPLSIVIGDIIAFVNEKDVTREGKKNRYTFA